MDITVIILAVIGVWYFGNMIGGIAEGASRVGSKQFRSYEKDHDLNLYKTSVKQSKELNKLVAKGDVPLTDKQFDALIQGLSPEDVD